MAKARAIKKYEAIRRARANGTWVAPPETEERVRERERRRIRNRERRIKRKEKEKSASKHVRVRRYVMLRKDLWTNELTAYDGKLWSPTHVRLHSSSRYGNFNKPQRVLDDLAWYTRGMDKSRYKTFIVRAGSKKCPISIDYQSSYDTHGELIYVLPYKITTHE